MTAAARVRRTSERALVDAVPAPLVVTRLDGTIEAANAEAVALLGGRGDLRGRPLAAFVGGSVEGALRELAHEGDGATVVRELPLAGRGRSGAVAHAGRRADLDGDVVVWSLRDAGRADRRRAGDGPAAGEVRQVAAELEAERARLAAILDGMPAGVLVAEAPAGGIVLGNPQADAMLGRHPREAATIADHGFGGLGDAPLEPADWPLGRALRTGEVVRDERIGVERADGSTLTVEANASPIRDAEGRIVAAVMVFWDVSDRERRERAEREFITNAAHELQTPLASIVSAVEVLNGGAKEIPADRDRFLGHVERESARLVRVVRSLLTLARMQLAHESVALAPVRLRPLLDAVALAVRPRRGIEVVVRCPARLTLQSNAELLEQAVSNLAANSARHTQRGRITISAARRDGGVRIEVSDTGSGITGEDAERLFDRFSRGDVRDGEGFGLGLAIVRETVSALGGTVSLAPRRGGGTVARIVFPEAGMEAA